MSTYSLLDIPDREHSGRGALKQRKIFPIGNFVLHMEEIGYLHNELAGHLRQDDTATRAFSTSKAGCKGKEPSPYPFSAGEEIRPLSPGRAGRRARGGALHQEDFCQALGIVSEQKYQKEGGPSLKQCFALLREVSSAPVIDLARLLDDVIFNYIVGNNDAHGKNFSLVYQPGATGELEIRLAPLYDVVSTVYYPELSQDMAMRIGAQYSPEQVTLRDFEKLADDAKLGKPLVRERLIELTERVRDALPKVPVTNRVGGQVADLIRLRCETALRKFLGR